MYAGALARTTAAPPDHVRDAVAVLRPLGGPDALPRPLTDAEADAVAVIYRAYAGMLLTVARRLLGSEAEAEDAVHDVFCRLPWVAWQYRGGGLGGWLRQTLVRTALMRLRAARRRREDACVDDLPVAALGAAPGDADGRVLGGDDGVRRALAALPESLRQVVVLRVFLDFSHQEIAEALDVTVGASEVRYCRALKQLRAAFPERELVRRAS